MVIMMVVVVVVVMRISTVSRTHSSMHLFARPSSDEIYGMFNEPVRKKSLQVFFDCLDTARKRDDESISDCACDRSRECCQRGVL